MKVAYYSPVWPPGNPPNGIATYVNDMVTELYSQHEPVDSFVISNTLRTAPKCHGRAVSLEKYTNSLDLTVNKICSVVNPEFNVYSLHPTLIKRAVQDLKNRSKIDVFEMEESFGWIYKTARSDKVLCVTRLHGPHFLVMGENVSASKQDTHRIRKEKIALQASHIITAPSQNVLDRTRIYYDLYLDQATVIPNGIKSAKVEHQWQLDRCERQTLLFVGRFDYIKGGDVMIDTFIILSKKYPELKLYFIGPDNGISTNARGKIGIKEYIDKFVPDTAQKRIIYLGYQSPHQVTKYRKRANVTVVTSRYEVGGYNVLEALGSGSPLICSKVGGLPEYYQDMISGISATSEQPKDFADKIETLIEDDSFARTLSTNALIIANGEKSMKNVCKKTLDLYKKNI